MNFDAAWWNLKHWLDTQQDYIVIPVSMIKARMNEEENLFGLEGP